MSPGGLTHIDSEGAPIPPTRISPAIRWRRRRRPVKRDGSRQSPSDLISAIPFDGAFSFLFISDNNNSPHSVVTDCSYPRTNEERFRFFATMDVLMSRRALPSMSPNTLSLLGLRQSLFDQTSSTSSSFLFSLSHYFTV